MSNFNQNKKEETYHKLVSIISEVIADESVVLSEETSLINTYLDSLSLMILVEKVEQGFGVEFGPGEVTSESFNTPKGILDLLSHKLNL